MPPKKSVVVVDVVTKPKAKTRRKVLSAGRKVTGRDVGASVGGFLGNLAQKAIQSISGMGDYTVKENSLYNGIVRSTGPPKFVATTMTPGCTQIMHREYIQDVVSPGSAFSLTTLPINPTNPITFPWLSIIADNFESYRFRGLVFEFVTNSATAVASTNTALGTVILATQYNIDDPAFTSKIQMEQYEYAVATVPFESAIHPVECARGSGVLEYLYTYIGVVGDRRFSTFGNFNIATVGQQATSNIGELWVSYDIELCKSRLSPYPSVSSFHWTATNVAGLGYSSPTTTIFTPNSSATVTAGAKNNLAIVLGKGGSGNSVFWPYDAVGTYICRISSFSNSVLSNSSSSGPYVGGGLVLTNLFPSTTGPASTSDYLIPEVTSTTFLWSIVVAVTVPVGLASSSTPALSFGNTLTAFTTTTWVDLWIDETVQIN